MVFLIWLWGDIGFFELFLVAASHSSHSSVLLGRGEMWEITGKISLHCCVQTEKLG